jgi:hypothetical protein
VIRLLAAVSWLVRWTTRSPRRVVGVLVLPVLLGVALTAGPLRDRPADAPVLAGGPTPVPAVTSADPRPSGLPPATGAVRPVPARPTPTVSADQRATAVGYVVAANTHDARPGRDKAFGDSYRRTKPYVTPELYALVTAESRRGDYEWTQWVRRRAAVSVEVLAVGVPDGAPAPTATTAYVRVQFRQVVRPAAGGAEPTADAAITVLEHRGRDGRWRVSRLLADT